MTDWVDSAARILPVAVPAVAALFAAIRGRNVIGSRIRGRMKHDAEVVEKLPESEARTNLLALLNDQVEELRRYDQGSRNISSLGFAFVGALLLGYLTVWLIRHGDWWWTGAVGSGLLATVFIYGIFESAQRVPRDEKGKRLPKPESEVAESKS